MLTHPFNSLPVTPGMYPHLHVGEGKPDDNSRSVVGVTHGLAWCAPRIFLLSLTTPSAHLHLPLLDAAVRMSTLILSMAPSYEQIRNMEEASLSAYGTLIPSLLEWPEGTSLLSSQLCLASQALQL